MVARRMYALRLGEVLPHRDIAVLRGIEGARMKETYRIAAERAGIRWSGRRYDRQNPLAADAPMPEPAPGVYAAAELSRAVRERLWAVVTDWHCATAQGSLVMLWRDDKAPGGLGLLSLGTPPRRLADIDGVLVSAW